VVLRPVLPVKGITAVIWYVVQQILRFESLLIQLKESANVCGFSDQCVEVDGNGNGGLGSTTDPSACPSGMLS